MPFQEFEPVWLYATPSEAVEARSMVNKTVTVKEAAVYKLWILDTGPVFVQGKDILEQVLQSISTSITGAVNVRQQSIKDLRNEFSPMISRGF